MERSWVRSGQCSWAEAKQNFKERSSLTWELGFLLESGRHESTAETKNPQNHTAREEEGPCVRASRHPGRSADPQKLVRESAGGTPHVGLRQRSWDHRASCQAGSFQPSGF